MVGDFEEAESWLIQSSSQNEEESEQEQEQDEESDRVGPFDRGMSPDLSPL